jgi:hypothetical protein
MSINTTLRIAALFIAILTIALWCFGGLNLGRSQWFVPVEQPGPDGQLRVVHEPRFLPGIDFLLGGAAFSGALLGASCLRSRPRVMTCCS